MMKLRILLQWSGEDQTCVVILPEWEGRYLMPVASGKTYEEAMARGVNALENIIAEAHTHDEPLPEPKVFVA
jgi:predicted RNase H-like HicB family nuclease